MLDVGFSELLLIVIAAILFIGPKDYPVVIRAVARAIREIKALTHGLRSQVDGVMRDAGLHDLHESATTIIDLDGKEQVAYDVRELEALRRKDDA